MKVIHILNNMFAVYCLLTSGTCRIVGATVVAIVAFANRKNKG